MRLVLVVLVVLVALAARPLAAEEAPVENAPAEKTQHQVLVLDLEAIDVDADKMKIINGTVVDIMSGYQGLEIVAQADIRQMVDMEAEKQALGCDTTSCLAEIAGAMGASYVVFGRVGRLDDVLFVQLNLFDSQKGRAVAREEVRAQKLSELPDLMRPALGQLTAPLTGVSPPPVTTTTTEPVAGSEGLSLPTILLVSGGSVAAVGLLAGIGLAAGTFWAEDTLGKVGASREDKTTAAAVGPVMFFGALGGAAVTAAGVGLVGASFFLE